MMGNKNGKKGGIPKLPSKIDLITNSQSHHAFIQLVKYNQHLFHPKVVKFAVSRYENYWLPFAAKHLGRALIAPLEIELIWVAHMQNNEAYKADCLRLFNQVIPHYNVTSDERKNNGSTKLLWEQMYTDKVPFTVNHRMYPESIPPYEPITSVDLEEAVAQYRAFCHHVSLPHYADVKFLQSALLMYISESIGNGNNVGITRDKEFVWRSHILVPHAYQVDSEKLKRKHKKIKNGAKIESPLASGIMSRGDVIPLVPVADEKKLKSLANKSVTFFVEEYALENLAADKRYAIKLYAKSTSNESRNILQSIRVSNTGSSNDIPNDEAIFVYHNSGADVLQVGISELETDSEEFCFDYDIFNSGNHLVGEEVKLAFSIPLDEGDVASKGSIYLRCQDIAVGTINLSFGLHFIPVSESDHVQNVLSHPLLIAPYHSKLEIEPCIYINKSLRDRQGEILYNCRVLKSLQGDFLCTEVLNLGEKLICSSYTVGNEILPTEEQVADPLSCCVLREEGEAVFVIRSSNYDWGLLKVFPMLAEDESIVPNKILFMNLREMKFQWECMYDSAEHTRTIKFSSGGNQMQVDINFGRISLPPDAHAFPEQLSLGVTLLALFHCFPYKGTLGHSFGIRQIVK